MKTEANRRKRSAGITMLEALFVGACVAGLVVFVMLPSMAQTKRYSPRIKCVSNLKQVGLAFRIFANDNDQRYPFFAKGAIEPHTGTKVSGNPETVQAWMHFQVLSNEISSTRVLVCPSDRNRWWNSATNLLSGTESLSDRSKRDLALSYFVGLHADEAKPDAVLSGDRNISLSTNGLLFSSHRAGGAIPVPDRALWSRRNEKEFHKSGANIGLADGSVRQVGSKALQDQLKKARLQYSPEYTNLVLFPQ